MNSVANQMVPLSQFIAAKGRLSASRLLGCTGPALANALRAGRTIFVEQAGSGEFYAVELSKFPSR
jgi:hypothetical protein